MFTESFSLFQSEVDVSTLRKDTARLSRTADFEKQLAIQKRYDRERNRIRRSYKQGYDKRLLWATESLAQRHGLVLAKLSKSRRPRDLKRQAKLLKAAHRLIEQDHNRRLSHCYDREAKELRDLLDTVRDRERGPQDNGQQKLLTDQRDEQTRLQDRKR